MLKTAIYNLNKPEAADPLRVDDFNENADKIDGLLKQVDDNSVTRSAQVRSEAANALAAYQTANDAAVAAVNTAVSTKAEQSAVTALTATVSTKAQVAVGSYTGKGTYGSSNKNTLTFDFEPKIVFIFIATGYGSMANTAYTGGAAGDTNQVFYAGASQVWVYSSGTGSVKYTLSGKTLTWYCDKTAYLQMNGNGTKYGYIAIG